MGLEVIFETFLQYGALGATTVLLIIFLIRKDRQVNALYVRLVEKSERDAAKYHDLAAAQNELMAELVEEIHEYRHELHS